MVSSNDYFPQLSILQQSAAVIMVIMVKFFIDVLIARLAAMFAEKVGGNPGL